MIFDSDITRAKEVIELHAVLMEASEARNWERVTIIERIIKERNVMEALHLATSIVREAELQEKAAKQEADNG